MLEKAKTIQSQITDWRRSIHQNPELGFQETRTAALIQETLNGLNIPFTPNVAKTGLTAEIGKSGPYIGIRADMDALPLQEENDVPYASQTPNVMHACGHDAHTAILLGTAKLLKDMEADLPGRVRLIFQPSEEDWDDESKSGAMRMVEEGAMEGLNAAIALHVMSNVETGKISIGSGYVNAAVDAFEALIIGKGGHGAYPHTTKDPVFALAQVINAINGIRARKIDPLKPAVISIGGIHGGSATNIIPEMISVNGTMRSYDEETRQQLRDELQNAFMVCKPLGCDFQLKIHYGYPATYNHDNIAQVIEKTGLDMLGKDSLHPAVPSMGAEDFSYMTEKVPGAMFFLGCRIENDERKHHNPRFDIDEDCLPIGAAMLTQTAINLMETLKS